MIYNRDTKYRQEGTLSSRNQEDVIKICLTSKGRMSSSAHIGFNFLESLSPYVTRHFESFPSPDRHLLSSICHILNLLRCMGPSLASFSCFHGVIPAFPFFSQWGNFHAGRTGNQLTMQKCMFIYLFIYFGLHILQGIICKPICELY